MGGKELPRRVTWEEGAKDMREQTTIRLPAELKEQLRREAEKRGDSLNETVIRLIRAGLEVQSLRFPAHKT